MQRVFIGFAFVEEISDPLMNPKVAGHEVHVVFQIFEAGVGLPDKELTFRPFQVCQRVLGV